MTTKTRGDMEMGLKEIEKDIEKIITKKNSFKYAEQKSRERWQKLLERQKDEYIIQNNIIECERIAQTVDIENDVPIILCSYTGELHPLNYCMNCPFHKSRKPRASEKDTSLFSYQ